MDMIETYRSLDRFVRNDWDSFFKRPAYRSSSFVLSTLLFLVCIGEFIQLALHWQSLAAFPNVRFSLCMAALFVFYTWATVIQEHRRVSKSNFDTGDHARSMFSVLWMALGAMTILLDVILTMAK